MNFEEILSVASKNCKKSLNRSSNLFNNVLPPPKKIQKSGVKFSGVQNFLAKRKAEEEARAAEAREKKEQLLALRAQSTKNNKKAKIMASRTKDNDFSRIKLTEDEKESKKKIEIELQRKHLADKVERMKARIELEEKEKLLPRKRKRKSKGNEDILENMHTEIEEPEFDRNSKSKFKNREKSSVKNKQKPPPPSFHDLLKMAAVKQHEPVNVPLKKKEDEKLLTKKQRRIMIEEEERQKRHQERIKKGEGLYKPTSSQSTKNLNSVVNKASTNAKTTSNSPVVIRVEKELSKTDMQRQKTEKSSSMKSAPIPKLSDKNKVLGKTSKPSSSLAYTNHDREKVSKNARPLEKDVKHKGDNGSVIKRPPGAVKVVQKKSAAKAVPTVKQIPPVNVVPTIDTAAIMADIEKKLREKFEKEMEERMNAFASKAAVATVKPQPSKPNTNQPNGVRNHVDKNLKKLPNGTNLISQRDEKRLNSKPGMASQKSAPPRPPQKKPFHANPYLDPPRRRLDPIIRVPKSMPKRRIESDSEDDDDDMDGFIDDSIDNQNEENYSKYIKEIFQYDRNKYIDDDDDEDITETSFADQMKEETRSARLGFLEDMEEERKLRELEKKRKQKKK